MNQTDPSIMDVYPNYMCFYIHQHITANVGILLANFLYFHKKTSLANPLKEMIEQITNFVKSHSVEGFNTVVLLFHL